eukprot:GEMP01000814.1.p1 GENE.GEMP01000814.1~~GEMP01000814.1.p1  ORF type:complete len:955 (-),score=183.25 GEMP01000814.1:2987-5851(-)
MCERPAKAPAMKSEVQRGVSFAARAVKEKEPQPTIKKASAFALKRTNTTNTFVSLMTSGSPNSRTPRDDVSVEWGDLLAVEASYVTIQDERPRAIVALTAKAEIAPVPSLAIEDPRAIPTIRDDSAFVRHKALFVDHWGRSALTDYSSTSALGGDGARCEHNGNGMMSCERNADSASFHLTMRHGPIVGSIPAEAHKQFENAYPDFDLAKDIHVTVDDVLATEDLDVLLKLQTMLVSAGCYTLAENVATRRLELCHDAFGPDDHITCLAHHSLGDIFLRAGLYMDAQHCFNAVLKAKLAARARPVTRSRTLINSSTTATLQSSPTMLDLELACNGAVCLCAALREQGWLCEAADRLNGIYNEAVGKFGTEHARTVHAAHELGATLLRQRRVDEAAPIVQEAVDQYSALLGADHPNTLHALINLAALQAAQGNTDAATDTYKQVLATRQVLCGMSHPETLECSRLLAIHRHGADESPFEQLVESWTAVRGPESLRTLCSVHDLGVWHCRLGNYSLALQSFQRALAGITKVCGSTHKATVDTCSKIFSTLMKQNNLADADVSLQSVTAAVQERCGAEHIDTCKAKNNVGVMHLRLFRCQQAYAVLQGECLRPWQRHITSAQVSQGTQPLEKPRATYTEDDVRYCVALQNLTCACTENNKWAEAESSSKRAWDELHRILGPEHPNTLRAMNNYGVALKSSRNLKESQHILKQVITLRGKVLGLNDPDTLESHMNLGVTLKLANKLEEAQKEQLHAYVKRVEILGRRHADTLDSQYYLALLMLAEGDVSESERLLLACVEGYKDIFGIDCPAQCQSFNVLAMVWTEKGDNSKSLECMRSAVEGHTRSRGADDPITLMMALNYAVTLRMEARYEDAVMMYERILPSYIEVEGPTKPTPLWIAAELAKYYAKLGKVKESRKYAIWAQDGFDKMRSQDMSGFNPTEFRTIAKLQETLQQLQ